ncbi:MAG: hypothetical protein PHH51_04010 [Bacilli bacterium]|nr:hypothetical protein [Bacilli bacterium]MDD4407095.1 hypothetical protein [Bacilli bacterium]
MKDEFKEMFFEAIKGTGMVTNKIRSRYNSSENLKVFTDEYYINEDAKLVIKHIASPHSILKNINNHIYEIKVQYSDGTSKLIEQLFNSQEDLCFNISEGYILSIYRLDNKFSNIFDIKKRKIIFPEDRYYSTCFDLHFESLLGKERYAWMREKKFDKRNCNNCEFGHYVYNLETNEETMTCENLEMDINFISCECPDSNKVCLYHEFNESNEFEKFKQIYRVHFAQTTLGQSIYMSELPENQLYLAQESKNKVLKKKN